MKHFTQLLAGIDVQPLLQQIEHHPELWGHDWTKHKPGVTVVDDIENIVLRFNKSAGHPGSGWNKPPFTLLSAAQPIIFDLMRAIPGEHLGKVVITKLPAGSKIDWHTDAMPGGITPYFQRYQIPLDVRPGVMFHVGDEVLHMEPGTAWWFDNQVRHAVFNDSSHDRISMLCDIRPCRFVELGGAAALHTDRQGICR